MEALGDVPRHPHSAYLLPYSPDLNPIELAFAKLKAILQKAAARNRKAVWDKIGEALYVLTSQKCANFKHVGYAPAVALAFRVKLPGQLSAVPHHPDLILHGSKSTYKWSQGAHLVQHVSAGDISPRRALMGKIGH
jgi:hypothetical protein